MLKFSNRWPNNDPTKWVIRKEVCGEFLTPMECHEGAMEIRIGMGIIYITKDQAMKFFDLVEKEKEDDNQC